MDHEDEDQNRGGGSMSPISIEDHRGRLPRRLRRKDASKRCNFCWVGVDAINCLLWLELDDGSNDFTCANKIRSVRMGVDPQEAGAKLQGLLMELCPKLAPGNSPR